MYQQWAVIRPVQTAGLIHQLNQKARSVVRDLDPTNDLTFIRIRTKKNENLVAPDKEYQQWAVIRPVYMIGLAHEDKIMDKLLYVDLVNFSYNCCQSVIT